MSTAYYYYCIDCCERSECAALSRGRGTVSCCEELHDLAYRLWPKARALWYEPYNDKLLLNYQCDEGNDAFAFLDRHLSPVPPHHLRVVDEYGQYWTLTGEAYPNEDRAS